jgi:hypothetical protein
MPSPSELPAPVHTIQPSLFFWYAEPAPPHWAACAAGSSEQLDTN